MNGQPVKEIPLVPRRDLTSEEHGHLMRALLRGAAEHDDADGCVCDVAVPADEETQDEDLPEARVPGLDGWTKGPRARRGPKK